MREYIEYGPVPAEESCAQVGEEDYDGRARAECLAYIALIRQTCGVEPEGAQLAVKSFPHDFGSYKEVVCYYDEAYPDSVDYAWGIEKNLPIRWTD